MKVGRLTVLAPALLLASIVVLVLNVRAAYRLDEFPEPLPLNLPAFTESAARILTPDERFLAALERNPFNPSRARTAARFGAPASPIPQQYVPPPHVITLRLVGTTAFGQGKGIAAVQANGQPARTLRLGDTIGGFVLRKVERGQAELRHADSTLVLKFTNQEP